MFGALVRLCGLSAGQAAIYLGVPRRSVVAWLQDESDPPKEIFQKLYELHDAQEAEVDRIINGWEAAGRPPQVNYRIAADDAAARAAGWPSVASQMTAVARAQATLTEVAFAFVQDA